MIYIETGQANVIILTLTETSTLSAPYYLFTFQYEGDIDDTLIELYLPDTSTATDRYNKFSLTEGSGTGDDVELIKGQYIYTIYECATQPTQVSDCLATPVEDGRMVTSTPTPTFTSVYD